MAGPSTVEQLVLVALFVLPGVSFQLIRELSRGLIPGERDLGERVLRAFVTSVVILAVYGTFAGQALLEFLLPINGVWFEHAFAHANQAAFLGLVLLVIVPAIAALMAGAYSRRISIEWRPDYPGQSAWDLAFSRREAGFVRARLKNGEWLAGWYDGKSRAAGSPGCADLYLSIEYEVAPDGRMGARRPHTDGLYINMTDVEFVQIFRPPPPTIPVSEVGQSTVSREVTT